MSACGSECRRAQGVVVVEVGAVVVGAGAVVVVVVAVVLLVVVEGVDVGVELVA